MSDTAISSPAFEEPADTRVSPWFILRISAFWLALTGLWAAMSLELLPVLTTHLLCPAGVDAAACATTPLDRITPIVANLRVRPEVAVGLLTAGGALVSVVVQPLAAHLSDDQWTRFGRRRPWIVAGVVLDLVFLIALANAHTFGAFAALVLLLQCSSNLAQGPFQGYIPDLIPQRQVGLASGLVGLMSLFGQLAGAAIAGIAVGISDPAVGFLGLAVLEGAMLVPTVVGVRERTRSVAPDTVGSPDGFLHGIREAFSNRGYVWLLISRMFLLMTSGTLIAVSEFLLTRSIGYSEAEAGGTILVMLFAIVASAAAVSIWAGRASDRYGRRRVIWWSCAIGAIGLVLVAIAPAEPHAALLGVRIPLGAFATIPVGIGAGMFVAVDWALLVDLVPKASAGRYLGLSNVVSATSGALAALIGGAVIAIGASVTGDPGFGPRLALGIAVAYYGIGALALRNVPERARASLPR